MFVCLLGLHVLCMCIRTMGNGEDACPSSSLANVRKHAFVCACVFVRLIRVLMMAPIDYYWTYAVFA